MVAAEPVDVDTLVAALREDHVVIDVVAGAGESKKYHDRLADLVREMPFDVYVALVDRPTELSHFDDGDAVDALTTLLQRRLGDDAVYVVATADYFSPRVASYGLGVDGVEVSLAVSGAVDDLEDRAEALVGGHVYLPGPVVAEAQVRAVDDIVAGLRAGTRYDELDGLLGEEELDELAAEASVLSAAQWWRPSHADAGEYRPASSGAAVAVGGVLGLLVALFVGQSLAGWPRRNGAPRPPAPGDAKGRAKGKGPDKGRGRGRLRPVSPVVARARAEKAVQRLRRALERDATRPAIDPELDTRALLALDVAQRLLDDTAQREAAGRTGRSGSDRARSDQAGSDQAGSDLVGAEMVALVGLRSHRRALSGTGAEYRPCFFDPRHGEGSQDATWRYGAGDVEVPVCRACSAGVASGAGPERLVVPGPRGPVPYWEVPGVWSRTAFGALSADLVTEVADALREAR